MATMIITGNVNPIVFDLLVDTYGAPRDITHESIELDHNGPQRELLFDIPGFEERDMVQIIGIEDEFGQIKLSQPMLLYED